MSPRGWSRLAPRTPRAPGAGRESAPSRARGPFRPLDVLPLGRGGAGGPAPFHTCASATRSYLRARRPASRSEGDPDVCRPAPVETTPRRSSPVALDTEEALTRLDRRRAAADVRVRRPCTTGRAAHALRLQRCNELVTVVDRNVTYTNLRRRLRFCAFNRAGDDDPTAVARRDPRQGALGLRPAACRSCCRRPPPERGVETTRRCSRP
jgi:hypothetical protein